MLTIIKLVEYYYGWVQSTNQR